MKKIASVSVLAVITIAFLLSSCVPQQKAASSKQKLSAVDSQLLQYKKEMTAIDAKREKKQNDNELHDTANSRIQKFIGASKAEIDKLVAQNSILIGETVVDREDWVKLKEALTVSQKSLKTIADKVNFINDLINRNTVVKLDQDVIFRPGEYKVPEDVALSIGNFFEPAAKEIDMFTQKYPNFPLSLVITAKGYADATTIGEGSSLYKDLKDKLKLETENPTPLQLNKELSNQRAREVIELFKKFSISRAGKDENIKNLLYLYEGKGESFPNPKLSDYKVDDPRRRVVLLFWSVFPD
jgi:hypothetical protein